MKNLLIIKNLNLNYFCLLAILLCCTNCTKDKGKKPEQLTNTNTNGAPVNCDTITFTYGLKVKEIINANCSNCHSHGSSNGYLLDYASLKTYVTSGELKGRLNGTTGSVMPPSGKLNNCDIKGIENWIAKGALNN